MGKYASDAYKSGYRDGKNRTYKVPHDGLLDHAFGISQKARRERREYVQGYRHGNKNRHR